MKMTKTTPTIIKVLVSSPVGVGEEGGTEVKPVVRMVEGEGVAEGAVIVEIIASPVGEEGRDGESPGVIITATIVAKNPQITDDDDTIHYLPILRLIIGAELDVTLRECKAIVSGDISKPQTLGLISEMLIAYCDFMSSLGRLSL